ncbi:MAG: hypothetical protein QMD36_02850 [Candidatus Aenigmarchaeota archaeon]|nr:hypothetical protein [Candidatus Aenigmarchaeota archaeon]
MSSDPNKLSLVDRYPDEKIQKIREYEFDVHVSIRRNIAYREMIAIKRIFNRIKDGKYKTLPIFESEKNNLENSIVEIIKSGILRKQRNLKNI